MSLLKKIKKLVKPALAVASVIPGPWQAPAIVASQVIKTAKGNTPTVRPEAPTPHQVMAAPNQQAQVSTIEDTLPAIVRRERGYLKRVIYDDTKDRGNVDIGQSEVRTTIPQQKLLPDFTNALSHQQGVKNTESALARIKPMSMISSLPSVLSRTLPRVMPGVGAVMTGAVVAEGAVTAGKWIYDQFGNPVRKRSKRMNVLNPSAARRAIRRIKGVRKMCHNIERQLPKVRVKSAPGGKAKCR